MREPSALYNNKTHTPNRFFTVEMPVAVITFLITATLWKATVIFRYDLFVAKLIPTKGR